MVSKTKKVLCKLMNNAVCGSKAREKLKNRIDVRPV